MEKQIRKALCKDCLKAVQKIEAKLMKARRLKVKLKVAQEKGEVKIKQK